VRILANAITKWERKRHQADKEQSDREGAKSTDSDIPGELTSAFEQLTEASHPLFLAQPLGSQVSPPQFESIMISPIKNHANLLQIEPENDREQLYQQALWEAEIQEAELKGQIRGQQAALVLQTAYANRLKKEIHGQEEKKKSKKSTTASKIREVNRKGRLLTDPELMQLYAKHENEIRDREAKKVQRKEMKGRYTEAMKNWNALEEVRKKKSKEIMERYQVALKEWEEEKELAKVEKRCPQWKKPVRGPLPKATPKSKMADFELGDSSGEEFDEVDDDATESDQE
jgi:hypothetical protein